jgi:hypothetical protein
VFKAQRISVSGTQLSKAPGSLLGTAKPIPWRMIGRCRRLIWLSPAVRHIEPMFSAGAESGAFPYLETLVLSLDVVSVQLELSVP